MENKLKSDPLKRIKHVAYCLAFKPPFAENYTLGDLIRHAKFRLSLDKKVLLHDPIWESYTDEQILVEYYAVEFANDKDQKIEFEASLNGLLPEGTGSNSRSAAIAWMDEMIAKEQAKKLQDQIPEIPKPKSEMKTGQTLAPAPKAADHDKIKEFSEFEEFDFVPPGK